MNDQISKAIQDAMADSALTAGTLKKFTALADDVKDLESLLENQRLAKERLEFAGKAANKTIINLEKQLADAEKKESDLVLREEKITELEKGNAVAKARAETMSDVFTTIFKVPVIRETVQKDIMTPVPSGGFVDRMTTEENKTTEDL